MPAPWPVERIATVAAQGTAIAQDDDRGERPVREHALASLGDEHEVRGSEQDAGNRMPDDDGRVSLRRAPTTRASPGRARA